VQFWIGVTDPGWFAFHEARKSPEVNFWQKSARPAFKHAPDDVPFWFKLKQPYDTIAGGGRLVSTQVFSIGLAWELFGTANGADSLPEFACRITGSTNPSAFQVPIACQLLTDVFYLPPELRVPRPDSFATNLVVGKGYGEKDADAASIYAQVTDAASLLTPVPTAAAPPLRLPKWGEPRVVRPRLHQGGFRARLFEAYGKRCALTGESTLPALDAAHIIPFAEDHGTHEVTNGLLLRADFHRLFDNGLVTIEPNATTAANPYAIRISPRIAEQWYNGKAYYRLDGQPLSVLPTRKEWRPDPDRLRWHNETVFQRA
jgi:putative restriction endonuclease